MLTASGIDLIYFEKDYDGCDTLSLNIYDTCLNPIVVMRQNDWITRTDVDEVEAAPRTPRLVIKSKIHRIDIRIDFLDRARMNESELVVASDFGIPLNENVLLVKLQGEIPAPCHAKFSDNELILNGRMHFRGNRISNNTKGIVLA